MPETSLLDQPVRGVESPLRSPFAGHAAFERPSRTGAIGVRLAATTLHSVTQVSTWPAGAAALDAALSAAVGTPVPARIADVVALRDALLMRTGPEEFLLVSDSAAPALPALRQAITPLTGSVTDLSHARCLIRIRGEYSREVLSKLFALDLRDKAFPVGEVRLTGHHHVACILLRRAPDTFDMFVFSTYAHDQLATVIDAALEYGVALAPAWAGATTSL